MWEIPTSSAATNTIVTLLPSAALNNLTVFYMSQRYVLNVWLPLQESLKCDITTVTIYCPMQSYLHNDFLRIRSHNASYLLSLLVGNLRLNVTNNTISIFLPTVVTSLRKRSNNTFHSLSFHGYAVTLIYHQGSLYYVYSFSPLYSSSSAAAVCQSSN